MPARGRMMLVARAGETILPMQRVTPPVLETARLRLRPLRAGDAEALNAIQSDPVHMRFYPHPSTMEGSSDWIRRIQVRYDEIGYDLLAVLDPSGEHAVARRGGATRHDRMEGRGVGEGAAASP